MTEQSSTPAAPDAPKAVAVAKPSDLVTLSKSDLRALIAEAVRGSGVATPDAIAVAAARPYQRITHPDSGEVICHPPEDGGPLTVSGLHPDDYFKVNEAGVAAPESEWGKA